MIDHTRIDLDKDWTWREARAALECLRLHLMGAGQDGQLWPQEEQHWLLMIDHLGIALRHAALADMSHMRKK